MSESPVVSIITVVYNRVHDIEYTLRSITGQTYPNIEYIVIDGGSSDGTSEILKKYKLYIQHFVSEKDNGIYDAMNKGLLLATGDYVLFINGGDALHDKHTIENIVIQKINKIPCPDIVFGECLLIDRNRNAIKTRSEYKKQSFPENLDKYSFKNGTNVSHQSFLVKREITPLYNLSYKWSSDVDWMLNCIEKAKVISAYPEIISDFVTGDSTDNHKIESLTERFDIMKHHYGLLRTLYFHLFIFLNKLTKR